ncbi:MAG: hypothetical protein GF334_05025 [Candidatus Altiarchaeales archaeon]|nr:hypothetical protein [Candidatus Altiarchaeales archaeon]
MRKHLLALLLISVFVQAQTRSNDYSDVNVTIYWGEGCPFCGEALKHVETLKNKYSGINVGTYEVYHNESNQNRFLEQAGKLNVSQPGVPFTLYCDTYLQGFNFESAQLMQARIENHCQKKNKKTPIKMPFLGKINPRGLSLPTLTILIAAVDGFNPCAMWMLCFLLALLVASRDRKKMIIIGSAFILSSAAAYYLYMLAWLKVFQLIGFITFTRTIVGLMVFIYGAVKMIGAVTEDEQIIRIPESLRKRVYSQMRDVTRAVTWPAAILGAVILAFTVNLVELLCTAGFPALYTKILEENSLAPPVYHAYLLLYNIVYMWDDVAVFVLAVLTLSSKKMQKVDGRFMNFVAGAVLMLFGFLFISNPQLLVIH